MTPPPPTEDAEGDPDKLRAAAEKLVEILQREGYVAYFAGGCVRDEIMGRAPTDYDVATDATPERVLELFRVARRVGEAFGVVMVRLKGCWIEVATFRTEWGYTDGRHPDHLVYSDAEHDARRRDFTINGLFYDPVADRVIDYVEGRADIERSLVRAIGDPAERFAEDYLRMLRAVRFAARLGFAIGPATAEAIRSTAPRLDRISRERIGAEVRMMLEHPNRAGAAGLMQKLGLDAPTLNEPNVDREPSVLQRLPDPATFTHATAAATSTVYPTALAAWSIDRHLPEHRPASAAELADQLRRLKRITLVRRWRKALMLSNEHRDALDQLLAQLPAALDWFELSVPRRKRLLGRGDWPALRCLLLAVLGLPAEPAFDLEAFEQDVAQLEAEGAAPEPLISGDDLIAAGLKPGPAFKRILEQTYDAQLAGEITTADEARQFALHLAAE